MFDSPQPLPIDYQLPADAYWHLIRTLRLTLPPPPDDSPEALLRRDHAVIARIAGLAPANAAEADVAAQFVAASEQWKDCLRLAQQPETTPEWAVKCRAQANAMMRQSNSALRLLLRMQEARWKLQADNVACDRLAWTEHGAVRLMTEALSAGPNSQANWEPAHPAKSTDFAGTPSAQPGTPPSASEPQRKPAPGAEPQPAPATRSGETAVRGDGIAFGRRAAEPEPDLVAAAERYAAAYPERAALIRRTGRLPHDVPPAYAGAPEAALAAALIDGASPALAALDRTLPEARAA